MKGLTAADFTVLEDGRPQSVEAFAEIDIPDPVAPTAPWMSAVAPDVRRNTDLDDRRLIVIGQAFPTSRCLTGVMPVYKLTPVTKTQIYLPQEELDALHDVAKRSGRSVAALVREAVRRVWLRPGAEGPVAVWDGPIARTSVDHDHIYDEP